MTDTRTPPAEPGAALLRAGRFFRPGTPARDLHSIGMAGGREADAFYRDRWSHDKVVNSTHGVNCTGSCRWKVYVKDGIITWETQQTDYPSVGPDRPEYEPRGCPRGAAFSWYTYSPTRVRYPYVRGVLLEMYREAKNRLQDPVDAWAAIQNDPERRRHYQRARGKGGLVRATWDEAVEIVAAAQVHTIKTYGPDRIAGFSPIPAMSMVSHAAGARFHSLIGAPMLSFYDWYADLPVASPQVFGDQTDVPESGDWWDAAYLVMWGSNVPVTRTPDAHWMAEARYRGQKVVVVAPDYADNAKFADEWLHPHPGTDGALALAMGQVILKEFFVDRETPFFADYVRKFTDLPFLVTLSERDGAFVPAKFLRASDLGQGDEGAEWKTVVLDGASGRAVVPECTFCCPRVEVGLPTVCSETCVGRLRYLGVVLYDADKVTAAASTPDEQALYEAQLGVFLDPEDAGVRKACEAAGIPYDWLEAARRSPVHALISRYRVALPLHPEYRTMPMVWYIPPLSPVVDALAETGHDGEDAGNLFGAIDTLRIPLEYLAEVFTAGDVGPVRASLEKLAAMRSRMRAVNLGEGPDPGIAAAVGMEPQEIEEMYRLPAIAKYEERYVIPTAAVDDARRLEESALPEGCSLDYDGGPGMGGEGPFGQDSGRGRLPLVSVENFHVLRRRQTTDDTGAVVPDEAKEV